MTSEREKEQVKGMVKESDENKGEQSVNRERKRDEVKKWVCVCLFFFKICDRNCDADCDGGSGLMKK